MSEVAGRRLGAGDWDTLADQVRGLAPLVFGPDTPDTPLHRAEGTRYLLRFLASGVLDCVEFMDPHDPEFVRFIDPRTSWGLDNPDCNYQLCGIDPAGTYRIWGEPGQALAFELQVNTGHFADGRAMEWRCVSSVSGTDLASGPDGSVQVTVGPQPWPGADARTRHLRTEPDATYVFLRQYFGDWSARPAALCIERLDTTLPPPPRDEAEVSGRLDLLGLWLTAGARCWWDWGRALAGGEPGPVRPFLPPASATGLTGQAYGMGGYRCAPDQAVILEVRPPRCRYWGVQLATWFWETAAVGSRQVSLNHTQAVADDDGVVRMVIAQRDPGVANWLDAAGYEAGTVAVRYLDADELPEVGYRTVAVDRVLDELPAGTVVLDAAGRDRTLRTRRAQLQRRLGR
jgi:hypothetical protein